MSINSIALRAHTQPSVWTDIENVFPVLHDWVLRGKRFALVTLSGIEGGSPRPLGAQMAVSENGDSFGYISGGCLKSEIISKALEAIRLSQNIMVRYGAGSPYMDITLPCGSGLDLYFDVNISTEIVFKAFQYTMERKPFTLQTDFAEGKSVLLPSDGKKETRAGKQFHREYAPKLKLFIFGTDPAVTTLARLGMDTDMNVVVYTPAEDILDSLDEKNFNVRKLTHKHILELSEFDNRSAAILYFHDHAWELPIMTQLLESDCFYIGAQGSRKTHRIRVEGLLGSGISTSQVKRIIGPIGAIPHTKSPAELAVSTLAEIITHARNI